MMGDLIDRDAALASIEAALNNATGDLYDAYAAIRALPAVTVGVKPLVWEAGYRNQRRADSILGEFCVTFFGGRWFYQGEPCKGMLDAQAAAQADYEARILAVLEPVAALDPAAIRAAALREAEEALRDWQDSLNTHRSTETAITVGMAADVVLALIGKEPGNG